MATLQSDLSAEVGPDHHFLVVPAVGEYLSLIAKGGPWARRGPAECSSLGLVAPVTLIIVFRSLGSLARSRWYTAFSWLRVFY